MDSTSETAQSFAECVIEMLRYGLTLSGLDTDHLQKEDYEFFLGYVSGYADVLAQASGFDDINSLSMTTTMMVYQEMFGLEMGQTAFETTDNYMQSRNPIFIGGMELGGEDANRLLSKGSGIPSGFIKKYRPDPELNDE